jgi:hypothetical protein
MSIWHRHEKEHGADDDGQGMEHAHDGGDTAHDHTEFRDQAVFNNYIGTIDGPTNYIGTIDGLTNESATIADGEANDSAAEAGELAEVEDDTAADDNDA